MKSYMQFKLHQQQFRILYYIDLNQCKLVNDHEKTNTRISIFVLSYSLLLFQAKTEITEKVSGNARNSKCQHVHQLVSLGSSS